MGETLIKVENLSKKFCLDLKTSLWYGLKDIASELTGHRNQTPDYLRNKEFWAVKDVSFEVKRGECYGIIGRNGAGKSTLLKMLNGLIKPDEGRIELHGRVGALIELGAGFNPILTGRENIFINAAVLGFTKEETRSKLDTIIDFAELREFIDTPVQNYSSGMKVRLGFAVAAQLEPDILLIDEVLAVGDMGFILKCFNKMDELQAKTALIFVSHNMPVISRICSGLTVMNKGKAVFQGNDVPKGISFYYNFFDYQTSHFIASDQAELLGINLRSGNRISSENETFEINHGEDLSIQIKIKINQPLNNPYINLVFYDKEQRNFGEAANFKDHFQLDQVCDQLEVTATFPAIEFGQGVFSIALILFNNANKIPQRVFRIQSAIYFKVLSKNPGWTPMEFTPVWTMGS